MRKSLFGGTTTEVRHHQNYKITLESIDGKFKENLILLDEPILCGEIPKVQKRPWIDELDEHNIVLSDLLSEPVEVEVLIGSDYWGKMMTGRIVKLRIGLISMETVWGWTLSGLLTPHDTSAMTTVTSLFTESIPISTLWTLDCLGIQDPIESLSQQQKDKLVTEHFENTVKRNEDGRYSISLPWIDGRPTLPTNRSVAEKRLFITTSKLQQSGKFESYDSIFTSWQEEDFIEQVDKEDLTCHFLPHRAVFKDSITTPVRPVYDASCKVGRNPSLNECLEKGPNLLELIPSILMRFREKNIGVISDIRKAFQMIEVEPSDRKFLRFLWWEDVNKKKLKIFQHKRVVFGVNCSPFLLQSVLSHHLNKTKQEDRDISEKLLRSLYVDNCVTSVDTNEEYDEFRYKSTQMLTEAKMDLRQWEATGDTFGVGQPNSGGCRLEVDSCLPQLTHVLGYLWDKGLDILKIDYSKENDPEKITKRNILSYVHKIYDPNGFTSPATLLPKILLQELWSLKLGWDEEIPKEAQEKFLKWTEDIRYLQQISIPRQIMTSKEPNGIQIHTFGDASQAAYAGVVFVRNVEEGKVTIHLVQAKARVSPLKKGTIPRLELLACLIGARLTSSVKEALGMKNVTTHYWTDSTTALSWIQRNDDWGTFVGNRVKQILKRTHVTEWRHVPGIMNPADLPSRGCTPKQLFDSKWWEGPSWLTQPETALFRGIY